MKELALITGASSGIGREIAREMAKRQIDLTLVARRTENLLELQEELELEYGITAHVFSKDLADFEATEELYDQVTERGLEVTMLVNNAGFGTYGEFERTNLPKQLEMIQVNTSSLVGLTHFFLQDMKCRNYGRIMNVGSILSFFPFPFYSVYAATKAFVLSFSEALSAELTDSSISVTCLCPGPTDTEFNTTEILKTNAYKSMKPVSARVVAKEGVDEMLKGTRTHVVGFMNKITAATPRFTPRGIGLKINKYMASQRS